MANYLWPSTEPFMVSVQDLILDVSSRSSRSILSGYTQSVMTPGSKFGWEISVRAQPYEERAQVAGFIAQLNGQEHRIQMWDFTRVRPKDLAVPLTGITMRLAASQFQQTLNLKGFPVGAKLQIGDWLSVVTTLGSQLFLVVSNGTADASGFMTVSVRYSVRGSIAIDAPVTLNKPTGLFILSDPKLVVPRGAADYCPPFSFTLEEVFR